MRRPGLRAFGALRYGAWIPIALGLYLIFLAWGMPHLAFNYTYRDDGRGYEPFSPGRVYTSCTYIGYYGHFYYSPKNGTCPWFKFYKADSEGKL